MLHDEVEVHNGFAGCGESRAAYLCYAVFTKRIAAEFMQ
jgi:hypothetical protein